MGVKWMKMACMAAGVENGKQEIREQVVTGKFVPGEAVATTEHTQAMHVGIGGSKPDTIILLGLLLASWGVIIRWKFAYVAHSPDSFQARTIGLGPGAPRSSGCDLLILGLSYFVPFLFLQVLWCLRSHEWLLLGQSSFGRRFFNLFHSLVPVVWLVSLGGFVSSGVALLLLILFFAGFWTRCRPGESFCQLRTLTVAGSLLFVSSFAGRFPIFPSPTFAFAWFYFLSGFFSVLCAFTSRRRMGILSDT
ncbi:unnamed protein product [Lactuca virosa]|uniref:GPI ethanolamine phosphate transferase 1 n=1 Tax=Lactuca virosa TaxID=75947 RepID=A0AAU9LA44_9ASTR|nr:unnamed protein product [Lactuca virosa]